jgi:hypothetical protein
MTVFQGLRTVCLTILAIVPIACDSSPVEPAAEPGPTGSGDFLVRVVDGDNADITIATSLYLPPGIGPHPAVVVVGGSDSRPAKSAISALRMTGFDS